MISLWLREGELSSFCSEATTSSTEPTVEPKQRLKYVGVNKPEVKMYVCMYICMYYVNINLEQIMYNVNRVCMHVCMYYIHVPFKEYVYMRV